MEWLEHAKGQDLWTYCPKLKNEVSLEPADDSELPNEKPELKRKRQLKIVEDLVEDLVELDIGDMYRKVQGNEMDSFF